jgi:hypothetical protein
MLLKNKMSIIMRDDEGIVEILSLEIKILLSLLNL